MRFPAANATKNFAAGDQNFTTGRQWTSNYFVPR